MLSENDVLNLLIDNLTWFITEEGTIEPLYELQVKKAAHAIHERMREDAELELSELKATKARLEELVAEVQRLRQIIAGLQYALGMAEASEDILQQELYSEGNHD